MKLLLIENGICIGVCLKQYAEMLLRGPEISLSRANLLLLLPESLLLRCYMHVSTTISLRSGYTGILPKYLPFIEMIYIECMSITYLIF